MNLDRDGIEVLVTFFELLAEIEKETKGDV
jgi:hypothetical protein